MLNQALESPSLLDDGAGGTVQYAPPPADDGVTAQGTLLVMVGGDEAGLDRVLAHGAARAREVAGQTMTAVRDRIGLLPPAL